MNTDMIESWIADDPDTTTAAELTDLLTAAQGGDSAAEAELADRFSGLLTFGTAGLRGHLGGGPNRMNRAVVIRAAAGLVDVLRRRTNGNFTLVIGHDARHKSREFAIDTAAVAVAAGGRALLLPRALPTPVTAFALRHLGADAAVVVTASHNPPEDNGYKVYLGGTVVTDSGCGSQIVPPFDSEIFEAIKSVPSVASVSRATSGWEELDETLVEDYLTCVTSLVDSPSPAGASNLRIVLTSMHGVGGATMLEALHRRGFTDVHLVTEQHEPDPDFPTVRFPNPEEPGALDLSFELAQRVNADIILANDPDADRCSAAVPDASAPNGWRQLTGDEVGSLLGEQTAHRYEGNADAVLANSIVSSRLLARIAAAHGLTHRNTLTGFKWISRVPGLVFGYEEALGYCVDPAHVRDKDGISACLRLATLAAASKLSGRTLIDELDDLARAHGLHATAPLTIRVDDLSIIATGMANLRAHGIASLAGSPVVTTVDLAEGSAELPPTDGLLFLTEANDRVVARPSGTEPKLKCYLEVIIPVENGDVAAARKTAAERLAAVSADVRAALGV